MTHLGLQLLAVFVPALITILVMLRSKGDFARNGSLFAWSAVLSAILATPWIQPYLHTFGQPATDVLIPPLFVVLYIFFGRYVLPSIGTAFAGTYLALIFGDLVSATINAFHHTPYWQPFTWIGGALLIDGLFLLPIFGAMTIWFLKTALLRGNAVSFLFGRNQHLRTLPLRNND